MSVNKQIKITNARQYEVIVTFMEKYPDLAKGYINSSEGKRTSLNLWEKISTEANAHGPPVRSVEGWKKVWADFKFFLKNKLRKNMLKQTGTGGGRFRQYSFSPLEEKVMSLIDLRAAVDGISGTKSFGGDATVTEQDENTNIDDSNNEQPSQEVDTSLNYLTNTSAPTIESTAPCNEDVPSGRTRGRKRRNPSNCEADKRLHILQEQCNIQKEAFNNIVATLKSLKSYSKENNPFLKKMCKLEEEKVQIMRRDWEIKEEEMVKRKKEQVECTKRDIMGLKLKRSKIDIEEEKLHIKKVIN